MRDVQDEINALWNGAAADYDSRPSHGFHHASQETAWKHALRALLPAPPADVLDVGCGTGVIAIALADLGYRVRSVDLAVSMLSNAQRKARQLRGNGVFSRSATPSTRLVTLRASMSSSTATCYGHLPTRRARLGTGCDCSVLAAAS